MDNLRAECGIAYIRGSIISIVPSSPKRSHSSALYLPRGKTDGIVTRLYTIRPCSSVSSIGSSSYISGSSLPLKSPTLKDHDIHSVIYERFSRSKGYGDLPLQFVAVFVAEDDIHPGRYNIVGTFGVGDLNVRPVPGSTSFHRLTWDLMIYECPPPPVIKGGAI